MQIGSVPIGNGAPLTLIAGLNVIESESDTVECARALVALAERHRFPLIFKASYDKANRSRIDAFRGPGLDEGLRTLARVKRELNLPILTDVHEPDQAKIASEIVDCIQVPRLPLPADRPDHRLCKDRTPREYQEGAIPGSPRHQACGLKDRGQRNGRRHDYGTRQFLWVQQPCR